MRPNELGFTPQPAIKPAAAGGTLPAAQDAIASDWLTAVKKLGIG